MCNTKDVILSSTAKTSVVEGNLVITPDNTLSPENEQKLRILITSETPASGMALPVQIKLNGNNYAVLDKFGNLVYGTQIYKNMILKGYYGNNGIGYYPHYQLVKLPVRYYYGV